MALLRRRRRGRPATFIVEADIYSFFSLRRLLAAKRSMEKLPLLWDWGYDCPHQARASVLHREAQLVFPRLRIEIHVQHQSLLQDLLIGIRVEGLVNELTTVIQHFAIGRIDGCVQRHVQMLAAGGILGRKRVAVHEKRNSNLPLD